MREKNGSNRTSTDSAFNMEFKEDLSGRKSFLEGTLG